VGRVGAQIPKLKAQALSFVVSERLEGIEKVVDTFLKENIIQPELNM